MKIEGFRNSAVLISADSSGEICRLSALALKEHGWSVEMSLATELAGDSWGEKWSRLVHRLEEKSGCLFLCFDDPATLASVARLSNLVNVVAVLSEASKLEVLEPYALRSCNAIVTTSLSLQFQLISKYPHQSGRLVFLDNATLALPEKLGSFWSRLNRSLTDRVDKRRFLRIRGWVVIPECLKGQDCREEVVNSEPFKPGRSFRRTAKFRRNSRLAAKEHKVIFAIPGGMISGVDTFTFQLARELQACGRSVEVLSWRAPEPVVGVPIPDDLPTKRLEFENPNCIVSRWKQVIGYLESNGPCIFVPNYDVEHSAVVPRLSENVKVALIAHSDEFDYYEHCSRLGEYCDAVVGVSRAIAWHLGQTEPHLLGRLWYIPYGVKVGEPRPAVSPDGPIRLIYLGRLVQHQKRVLDIIQLCDLLVEAGIDFQLDITGDGPERQMMEEALWEHCLARRVLFTGVLPHQRVLERLRTMDALLLTSEFEGLSVAMLEGMANSVVPIVSDIRSGVPDAVQDGINGMVCPVGRPEAFVEAIRKLSEDRQRLMRMRDIARETIIKNGFLREQMVDSYLELFRSVETSGFVRPVGKIAPPPHVSTLNDTWTSKANHLLRRAARLGRR